MHQTRSQVTRRIPIPRKGTKYVARALNHKDQGVPVVVAVRDMLGLARTSKEVKKMKQGKMLKINGKEVKDIRECIKLLNLFEADKIYRLEILPTGRFTLVETKDKTRIVKAISKKNLRGNKIQINFHDGTNVIADNKLNVGDSVEIDLQTKIKKVLPLHKGSNVVIESGKSSGRTGSVENIDGKIVTINLGDKTVELDKQHVIVLQ